jgi:hypothetical protein
MTKGSVRDQKIAVTTSASRSLCQATIAARCGHPWPSPIHRRKGSDSSLWRNLGPNQITPATEMNDSCAPAWKTSLGLRAKIIKAAAARVLKPDGCRCQAWAAQAASTRIMARTAGGWASVSSV